MRTLLRRTTPLPAVIAVLVAGCNGTSHPTAATPTVVSVQVGISGNGSSTLQPGETRQLFATAGQSDGTSIDVTNLATWQSSSPATATVSPSGLLTAAAEGAVDVTATYKGAKGSQHAEITPTCAVSLSPASAVFTAFGGSRAVTVTVNASSCAWTARSDAAWWKLSASGTGSGSRTYALPPNTTTSARTASVVVETANGAAARHTVSEDRPLGCSYVTQPDELTFTAAGGTAQFNVIATPGDCRWSLVNGLSQLGVSIISGSSGTGNGLVRYSVQAHTRGVDADGYIEIAGVSGLNPNGRHHIIILKR